MRWPRRPLSDILDTTAIEIPDRAATAFLGAELTFRDIKLRSDWFAAALDARGIQKGDRVGIMLPNCPQYIIAAFGVLRLGAIVVNINPTYTVPELLGLATDSGICVLLTLDSLAPVALAISSQSDVRLVIVTSLAEYSSAAADPPRAAGALSLADLLDEGRNAVSAAYRDRDRRCRCPSIHGRHDRHAQRRDAHARKYLRQRGAERDLVPPRAGSWRGALPHGDPVLPHLRVHGRDDVRHVDRRAADFDSQIRCGTGASRDTRLQAHVFPCRADHFRVAPRRTHA